MYRLSRHLKLYVGLVAAAGAVVMALSVWARPIQPAAATIALSVAFATLTGLAGIYPIPLSPKIKATVATAPAFAAVLLLSPGLATIAAAAGALSSELVHHRRFPYVLFNTATAAIYVGAAALAYSTLMSPGTSIYAWPSGILAAAAAAALIFVLNRALVTEAAALQRHENAFHLWLPEWKQDVTQEGALFSLGFAGAIAMHFVIWSIIPLVLPVAIIYKTMAKTVALSKRLEEQMAELRATQAQLVQAAKLASLGTLTAGLGHQINNPIFVIRGRTELLLEGADRHVKTEKAKQHIEVIHEMADRVARIVRCLLTSTRPSEDGRASADINDALETMLTLLESKTRAARVTVTRRYQENIPLVPGDAIEIQELLGNLIANACDAMSQGGELTITTRSNGQRVIVDIADTGVGIRPEHLGRIFDPFFTTKETSGGVGLGLYVVKNLAEKHGGSVEVESSAGIGTTFHVALPAAEMFYQGPGKQTHPHGKVKVRV